MKTCPVCDTDYPDKHATCPSDGAVLIESHELTEGSLVRGKYRIVRKLGQGGMGIVYLAEDILLNLNVALKFLAGDLGKDPKFIKRFRMEARAAYQLRHPNIIEVTNLDQAEDGCLFIAMEFVKGPSLRAVLEEARGPLEAPRALRIAREIASGLAAAHAQGIVHRDIKPENILLAPIADGRERPKILDFGLVAVAESATRTSVTRGLMLTANYAAPEQWMGMPASEMDGRTDLYALGSVLFETLTGGTPFHAHHLSGWMKQHLEEAPRPPSQFRRELAGWPGLDALVLRMLAKDRDQRPRDAGEVIRQLDAMLQAAGQHAQIPTEPIWERGDWEQAETIGVVPSPLAETLATPTPPFVAPVPTAEGASQPPISQVTGKRRGFPLWAWTAVAVLTLIAAFFAWRKMTPYSQPQQAAESPVTQPLSRPGPVDQPVQAPGNGPANSRLPAADISGQEKPAQADSTKQLSGTPAAATSEAAQKPSPVPAEAPTSPATQDDTELPKDKLAPQPGSTVLPKAMPGNPGAPAQPPQGAAPPQPAAGAANPPAQALSVAELARQAEALDKANRSAEAAPLYDQACAGGNAAACRQLGRLYTTGKGVAKDDSRAVSLYSKACDAGNAEGCLNLGIRYLNGQGVTKDDSQALARFTKACDGGNADGCTDLGTMYEHGVAAGKDDSRAVALYSRGCAAGSTAGCGNLAKAYVRERGNLADAVQILPLISKSCDGGELDSCNSLGTIYDNGYRVARDPAKALVLFSRACDGGNAPGCTNLGNYYRLGLGVAKDFEKAKLYLSKACSLGYQRGCVDLREVH